MGTKLQVIITKMYVDSCKESPVIKGTVLVKLSDEYFWFHRPEWILHLLQFILIQVDTVTTHNHLRILDITILKPILIINHLPSSNNCSYQNIFLKKMNILMLNYMYDNTLVTIAVMIYGRTPFNLHSSPGLG